MPTYEYECSSCGKAFEAFQAMADAPLTDCPSCGKAVKRVMSGGMGVIFKGSGFYKNDVRSSSSPAKDSSPSCCSGCSSSSSACPASTSG